MASQIPDSLKEMYDSALKARENAYAPYSQFRVGAVLKTATGKTYPGCNVENVSNGATVCAERGAIQSAICAEGKLQIAEILVVTQASPLAAPCGLCRQVMAEFAQPDSVIHVTNIQGEYKKFLFKTLLPEAYTPRYLLKS